MTTPNNAAMLERVRKLLAKAEAEGVTPQEAEALSAKAAELMAKHGIDAAIARAKEHQNVKPTSRIFDVYNPWGQVRALFLAGIARALGCQCVMLSAKAADADVRVHVFGYADDIAQVDMLYTSLTLQMSSAHKRVRPPAGVSSVRAWNRSWLLGWTSAVAARVREAYARAERQAEAERTSGQSTALVLADRSLQVKAAVREAYPRLRSTRITYSVRGYSGGYAEGQRANIHNRSGVASNGRALSR